MNVYLVSRTDFIDYDQYDAMVVVAESEERARRMTPNTKCWGLSAPVDLRSIHVELIGYSVNTEQRIVLSSYNAG